MSLWTERANRERRVVTRPTNLGLRVSRTYRAVLVLSALLLLFSGAVAANGCAETDVVSFDDFMHGGLSKHVRLSVRVPTAYRHADLKGADDLHLHTDDVARCETGQT